eukprot:g65674.t1
MYDCRRLFSSKRVFSSPFSNLSPRTSRNHSPLLQQHTFKPSVSFTDARIGRLRSLLETHRFNRPLRMLETHSGLTGLIAENVRAVLPNGELAEFDGLWSSSLTASTTQGMPDIEVVDTSSRLRIVRETLRTTTKPLIYDGDTGGYPAIFQYTVKSLQSMGVSACIIEDKAGLKQNSLFGTDRTQCLEDIDEFCEKIKKGQEAKTTTDFMIIARLEALIAGAGQEECLRRAVAYVQAGADGIMIHSKSPQPDEVLTFLENYYRELGSSAVPVVAVPSTYNSISEQELGRAGVSIVIYANHMLRAAYPAMLDVASSILLNKRSLEAEERIIPIKECLTLVEDHKPLVAPARANKPAGPDGPVPAELNGQHAQFLDGKKSNGQVLNGQHFNGVTLNGAQSEQHKVQPAVPTNSSPKVEAGRALLALNGAGVDFFCGVPDSLLEPFCKAIHEWAAKSTDTTRHLVTANEGAAVATASGYHMATGKVPCVYLQNSGFGNAVNPLLSLAHAEVYGCPMVLVVGWRGQPGTKDEPQHQVQGRLMLSTLEALGLQTFTLPNDCDGADQLLACAVETARSLSQPVVVLVPPKTFKPVPVPAEAVQFEHQCAEMKREEALALILTEAVGSQDAVVATTGFTSRELYELRNTLAQQAGEPKRKRKKSSQDFLTVGSMGHALAIAQGIALAQPGRRVWCLDGDGAALMHMGSMAALGALGGLPNLRHVVLNNGVHESVGGQPVCGLGGLDFPALARAVGYPHAQSAHTRQGLSDCLLRITNAADGSGAQFLELKLKTGTRKDLGRPKTSPVEAKKAFMRFLQEEQPTASSSQLKPDVR